VFSSAHPVPPFLSYIIACSKDEVVDVTQRYTKRWNEVLERRTACPEQWLRIYVQSLTQIKAMSLPPERARTLAARALVEAREFEANVAEDNETRRVASLKEEEKQGRTTGSVEWRAARGELGADAVAVERALHPDQCAPSSSSSSSSASSSSAAASSAVAAAATAACETPAGKTAESAKLCSTNPATDALADLSLGARDSTSPPVAAAAVTPATAASASSAAAAAPLTDAQKLAAAKARTAALFRTYMTQLQSGCGSSSCDAKQCRSNATFAAPAAATDVAKMALEMTKTGPVSLCPRLAAKNPSS
jgi:hypothetical protein